MARISIVFLFSPENKNLCTGDIFVCHVLISAPTEEKKFIENPFLFSSAVAQGCSSKDRRVTDDQ